MYNKNVSEKVQALSSRMEQAKDVEGFFTAVTEFYRDYGVGMFGLNKAFRIQDRTDSKLVFLPINNMDKVMLSDLVGYEIQKKKLWIIPVLSWKAKKQTMCCSLVTAEPVNQPVLKPLSMSFTIRDCA